MYNIIIKQVSFSWDISKNKDNIIKHNVSFEEASSVFVDNNSRLFYDPRHSENEDRYIILGLSDKGRLLVVSHCYRNNVIRIISARKATKNEQKEYKYEKYRKLKINR